MRARLGVLPPSSLRPRRVAEDFHVVAVTTVKEFGFDTAAQTVRATLVDARKDTAALEHPFSSRGREGAELLLDRLEKNQPESLRFIAGPARLGPRGLMFFPTALVFQDGASRQIVQPWVDRVVSQTRASELTRGSATTTQPADPIDDYPRQLLNALSELALLGLQRADAHARTRSWRELARFGESIGFHRLTLPVAALADALEQKSHTPRWDPRPAARVALELTALARLALDVSR